MAAVQVPHHFVGGHERRPLLGAGRSGDATRIFGDRSEDDVQGVLVVEEVGMLAPLLVHESELMRRESFEDRDPYLPIGCAHWFPRSFDKLWMFPPARPLLLAEAGPIKLLIRNRVVRSYPVPLPSGAVAF